MTNITASNQNKLQSSPKNYLPVVGMYVSLSRTVISFRSYCCKHANSQQNGRR